MRKSVERRRQSLRIQRTSGRNRHAARAVLWLFVVLAVVAAALFLAYSDWQARQAEHAASAKLARIVADVNAKLAARQKKIDDAKSIEAAAKSGTTNPLLTTLTNGYTACDVTHPDDITVILNKKHCFSPISWAPSDLTSLNGFLLRQVAVAHMSQMMDAASTAGAPFGLSSAYRSYTDQQATYANWVTVNGSSASADAVSARPGFSEHQSGLAADLKVGGCALECFGGTSAYQWLAAHAAEFGFIRRYPDALTAVTGYEPEPWHWRYVGVDVATDMKRKGIETLEAYFGVSGGNYAN